MTAYFDPSEYLSFKMAVVTHMRLKESTQNHPVAGLSSEMAIHDASLLQ